MEPQSPTAMRKMLEREGETAQKEEIAQKQTRKRRGEDQCWLWRPDEIGPVCSPTSLVSQAVRLLVVGNVTAVNLFSL